MKEVLCYVDLSMFDLGDLVKNLVSVQYKLRKKTLSELEITSLRCDFGDVLKYAENILENLKKGEEHLLLERKERPKNLKLTSIGLYQFDSVYFDYLNPESSEYDYYKNKIQNKKEILGRHLATWVYDDGDQKEALNDVKNSFGNKVFDIVRENIKHRRHDT